MENTFSVKMIFHFYHSVVKAELKRRGFPKEVAKKIEEEHGKIVARAKDIGKSKLLSSYIMASYCDEQEHREVCGGELRDIP